MIIVTDAHVSPEYGNVVPFFQMLEGLSRRDDDIVFLGDIFELWVGLARYESDVHHRFLSWCDQQKQRRIIGLVEGNHEFYVASRHRQSFSWASNRSHFDATNGTLFVHGDLINRADKNYLRFRKLTKNPMAKAMVRILPRGPAMVQKLKTKLKTTNQDFRIGLPVEAIKQFAKREFARGARQIVVGHFHQDFYFSGEDGKSLRVLPDWLTHQTVGLLTDDGISIHKWQTLCE